MQIGNGSSDFYEVSKIDILPDEDIALLITKSTVDDEPVCISSNSSNLSSDALQMLGTSSESDKYE